MPVKPETYDSLCGNIYFSRSSQSRKDGKSLCVFVSE